MKIDLMKTNIVDYFFELANDTFSVPEYLPEPTCWVREEDPYCKMCFLSAAFKSVSSEDEWADFLAVIDDGSRDTSEFVADFFSDHFDVESTDLLVVSRGFVNEYLGINELVDYLISTWDQCGKTGSRNDLLDRFTDKVVKELKQL